MRLEKATVLLGQLAQKIDEEKVLELVDELGWLDAVSFTEKGTLEFTLNDLQLVGLATALAAYAESTEGAPK